MEYLIFKPIKHTKSKYTIKPYNNNDINTVSNVKNLNTDFIYYAYGEIKNNNFVISKIYQYLTKTVYIKKMKVIEGKKNKATMKSEEGENFKAIIDSSFTEIDKLHIMKGYFDEKGVFQSTFIKKLITINLRITSDIKQINKRTFYSFGRAEIVNNSEDMFIKKEKIKIKGKMYLLYKNDEIFATGYEDEDDYGPFFMVLSYEKDISSGLKMMSIYLKNVLKGVITPNLLNKIIKFYDTDVLNILENNPEKLLENFKIKEDKLKEIKLKMNSSKFLQEFFYFCEKENINSEIADYIYKQYNVRAIDELKKNPYILIDLRVQLFAESDIFAKKFGWTYDSEERLVAGIKCFLYNETVKKGDVFTKKDTIYEEFNDFINFTGAYDDCTISKSLIDNALSKSEDLEIIKIDKDDVYLTYNYYYENNSARIIKNILTDFKPPFCKKANIKRSIDNYKEKLADKQIDAVYSSLLNNISILTGGPGTGKTSTIKAILYCIKDINKDAKIKLCAPTGRASKRMTEVSGFKSETIHKLLEISVYEHKDESSPKEIIENMEDLDFLIIDEFSMVDIKLFHEILTNLDYKTRLIIVGDYNQLPSVSAGQVLKDLIESNVIPIVELTEVFRQAEESNIIMTAHKIIKKEDIDIDMFVNTYKDVLTTDFSFIKAKSTENILGKLQDVLKFLFDNGYSFKDIQILSAMNKGLIGTNIINREIQEKYNNLSEKEKILNEYTINDLEQFRIGDKVIQTVNDYNIQVMNGSIGFISRMIKLENASIRQDKDELFVDFTDEVEDKIYDGDSIRNLKLAYSVTIHKSQGSEFPIVIIPFHKSQEIMLNVNLLYTAITRAKNRLIIIGDPALFKEYLKISSNLRNSNLIKKIL